MDIIIKQYQAIKHFNALQDLIHSEGEEWKEYLQPAYEIALVNSITYVAYSNNELCGYSRSIQDSDLYIWVIDLLVYKKFRGHSIGRRLMECIIEDHPDKNVYVMSDVDDYYIKLGYKKEGSIFKVG